MIFMLLRAKCKTANLMLLSITQASSEHPLAKAILDYAFHFHFFGKLPSSKDNIKKRKEEIFSQWLLDVSDFSALPGKGIQCWVNGKKILVSCRIQVIQLSVTLSFRITGRLVYYIVF
jgi:P-type Cu+ transporter